MKYFTNLFVFLAWYLDKITDIHATSTIHEEQIQKLILSEKLKSHFAEDDYIMIALKRNVLILTDKKMYNIIYSENAIRILETGENYKGHLLPELTSKAKAPDAVFGVPSYTITSAGKISQLDVSDPMKPRINDFIEDSVISRSSSHVWISKNEFILLNHDELIHFGHKIKGFTHLWNSNKVSKGQFFNLFQFQFDPKSFVIVYATSIKDTLVVWPEDAEGKPGDWRNEKHIKQAHIGCDANFLTSADVNNDGKIDLLFSKEFEKKIGDKVIFCVEVRAFELPHSEEFKNPDKYKEHVLFAYPDDQDEYLCITHMKAFIPFVSYKGKPWILVGEDTCGGGSYLQPENDEVGNWNYKRMNFLPSLGSTVWDIEVADIDEDGYTELFLLADRLYVYSFSNDTITVTDPQPTPTSFICVVSVVVIVIVIIVVVAFLLFKFGYLSRLCHFFGCCCKRAKN